MAIGASHAIGILLGPDHKHTGLELTTTHRYARHTALAGKPL